MDAVAIDGFLLRLDVAETDTPVLISLTVAYDRAQSVDDAGLQATLVDVLPTTRYASLDALVERVLEVLFRSYPWVHEASIAVTSRDADPRISVETTRKRGSSGPYRFVVGGVTQTLLTEQSVVLDVTVHRERHDPKEPYPFSTLLESITTATLFPLNSVEALASTVACDVLNDTKDPDDVVTVKISKPNALDGVGSTRIQITRRRSDFADVFSTREPLSTSKRPWADGVSVALALGSNLSDRFVNIETALRLLEVPRTLLDDLPEDADVSVVDTSFMYETAPMYVTDQPRFANCACMIETNLLPVELLRLVKEIETVVGRVPTVRFGPRAVDVDILTYGDKCVDTRPPGERESLDNLIGELVIPHPRICEREFVLRPLNDIIPHFIHPGCKKTIRTLLEELVSTQTSNDFPMFKVLPFPKYPLEDTQNSNFASIQVPPTAKYWTLSSTEPARCGRPRKTYLMATLNVTPDSFSDGAQHNTLPAALAYTSAAVAAGADIIDIGGCSTRPRADPVSPADELARVLPVISAIRAHPTPAVRNTLVSVDTFRWDVAERAVRAGANCINDVYAFTGPGYPPDDASTAHLARMRRVARALGVPVVLMHSRGDAGANKDYRAYDGIIPAVRAELGRKVDAIVRGPGGVRRWLVLVDPGIGFSKPVEGQLALMRGLAGVTAEGEGNALAGYPLLVGPSRKSVWGAVLAEGDVDGTYAGRETTAQERGWATAAAVACAVQQGANVVRVHDVAEMRDVVAVASAIWNR